MKNVPTFEEFLTESKEIDKPSDNRKNQKNSNQQLFDTVRQEVGDYSDAEISSITDQLEEAGITDKEFKIRTAFGSQQAQSDAVNKLTNILMSELRPGMEHKNLSQADIRDIVYGLVQAKNFYSNNNKNEAVDPAKLVGKSSQNYHGAKGKIVAAAFVKDFDKLEKYDNSGWMAPSEFRSIGLRPNDILVAFEDVEGDVEVYTYGDGGVDEI